MIQIISSTDRPESRSLEVSKIVQAKFQSENIEAEVMALCSIDLHSLDGTQYGGHVKPGKVADSIEKVNRASGLFFVVPEYNGSFPGAVKHFIDHWTYPESFESRPVAFVGLGGMWGGLRPVEHLQGVFGYRNAYIFPERVFINNVWEKLKDGAINHEITNELLDKQVVNFGKFVKALKSEGLSS